MRFYVYELIDPRNGKIFYVGKGQGKRYAQHELEARKGVQTAKCRLIREILAAGHAPAVRIIREFRREETAYKFEMSRISKIGLANLTNILPGGRSEREAKSDPDAPMARVLVAFACKTNGFEHGHTWRYGCRSHRLSDHFLDTLKERLQDLIQRRGLPWLKSLFPNGRVIGARYGGN